MLKPADRPVDSLFLVRPRRDDEGGVGVSDAGGVSGGRGRTEPWVGRAELRAHLGHDDWWIELRLREGMPSRPCRRPREFRLSQVDRWLAEQGGGPPA